MVTKAALVSSATTTRIATLREEHGVFLMLLALLGQDQLFAEEKVFNFFVSNRGCLYSISNDA